MAITAFFALSMHKIALSIPVILLYHNPLYQSKKDLEKMDNPFALAILTMMESLKNAK